MSEFSKPYDEEPEEDELEESKSDQEYLPDPGEETGSEGDLGGGYNSLNRGEIEPPNSTPEEDDSN